MPKRPVDPHQLLDQFVKAQVDAPTVHNIQQRLELHVTGNEAYVTSYTRQVMNQNHGAPVLAVYTKTDTQNYIVYIYPARNPEDRAARKLRSAEGLGPAIFGFGVPLNTLKLKLPPGRRYILPLNTMEVPNTGTVYWTSFADLENEIRNTEEVAAAGTQMVAKAPASEPHESEE